MSMIANLNSIQNKYQPGQACPESRRSNVHDICDLIHKLGDRLEATDGWLLTTIAFERHDCLSKAS